MKVQQIIRKVNYIFTYIARCGQYNNRFGLVIVQGAGALTWSSVYKYCFHV